MPLPFLQTFRSDIQSCNNGFNPEFNEIKIRKIQNPQCIDFIELNNNNTQYFKKYFRGSDYAIRQFLKR